MNTFELAAATDEGPNPQRDQWGITILRRNVLWFTRLRWLTAGVLALGWLLCLAFAGSLQNIGLILPRAWPLVLAGILAAANIPLSLLAGRLDERSPEPMVRANLWAQIGVDLVAVTVLVHLAGSITTFASSIYLIHVVLACIFLSRRDSGLITLLATILYFGCVSLEIVGVLTSHSMLAVAAEAPARAPSVSLLHAGSACAVWFLVWALVSTLSETVRARDRQLMRANAELILADRETYQRLVQTISDLKTAFSGIKTSTDFLQIQDDEIPDRVKAHILQIHERTISLEERLRDILLLGDMQSASPGRKPSSCNLKSVFERVVDNVNERAWAKGVKVEIDVPPIRVNGPENQLAVLFTNLVANAIAYSHAKDVVKVSATRQNDDCLTTITDKGIGIDPEDLPCIFDEYFRCDAAKAMSPSAPGLGLAIVKDIARALGVKIRVESEPGKGSTFQVAIPVAPGGDENLAPSPEDTSR